MIELHEVSKSYGNRRVVDRVSFSCSPGNITGFLGPNGAGKSTTMRIICGLAEADSGSATVLGRPFAELANPVREIGVLLDANAQHSGRTGLEVLELCARVAGMNRSRAAELLARVGLEQAADKRIGTYSLGMRQRLGIAHALIGDPRVLILDEPANGLDPEGIRWLRTLLREFADAGGTVLLSSHLLREVDAVADRLVVLSDGRVVSDGARTELLAGTGTTARSEDSRGLLAALSAAGLAHRTVDDGSVVVEASPLEVSRAAFDAEILLTHLSDQGDEALEELFFELVSDAAVAA